MMSGKTPSGFEYEIDENALNNYELMEKINELDENPLVLTKVVTMILGKEQTEKLKDHIRLENGTVPIEKMSDEIMQIFNSQPVKNS